MAQNRKRPRHSPIPIEDILTDGGSINLSDLNSDFDDDDIQIIEQSLENSGVTTRASSQTSNSIKRKRTLRSSSQQTSTTLENSSQQSPNHNANETVMFVSETPATRNLPPPSPELEFVCEEIPEPHDQNVTSPENDFTIIESASTAQPNRSFDADQYQTTTSITLPRIEFTVDRQLIAPPPAQFSAGPSSMFQYFQRNLQNLQNLIGGPSVPRRNVEEQLPTGANLIGSRLDQPLNNSEVIARDSNQTAEERFEQIRRRQAQSSAKLLERNKKLEGKSSKVSKKTAKDLSDDLEEEDDSASACPICMLKYAEIKKIRKS